MKKQILTFLLAILLLLTACQASDPDAVPETTVPMEVGVLGEPEEGYPYSNMHKLAPSGNFMRYGDKVVFFGMENSAKVHTYDIATGEVTLFCEDATCRHLTGMCPAGSMNGCLESYDGVLYGMSPWGTMYKYDGTMEPMDLSVSGFFHADGDLYITTQDGALMYLKDGTGAPEMLLEEGAGLFPTLFGDHLYFHRALNVCHIDLSSPDKEMEILFENTYHLTDGHHIYYESHSGQSGDTSMKLYRCDMEGKNPELLVEESTFAVCCAFDDTHVYYARYLDGTGDKRADGASVVEIYRFPKDAPSQKEFLAELPEIYVTIYTVPGVDKVFLEGKNVYVMNPNGSDLQKLELYSS